MQKSKEYQIIGRYNNDKETIAYELKILSTGEQKRFSREQVIMLAAKNQIINCTVQLYKDTVMISGKGCELSKLPTISDNVVNNTNKDNTVNENIDKKEYIKNAYKDALNHFMKNKILGQYQNQIKMDMIEPKDNNEPMLIIKLDRENTLKLRVVITYTNSLDTCDISYWDYTEYHKKYKYQYGDSVYNYNNIGANDKYTIGKIVTQALKFILNSILPDGKIYRNKNITV